MGTIRHEIVIGQAPTWPDEEAREFREKVETFRAELPEYFRQLLVGPVESTMNDYRFYAFFPDGGKEWWSTSDEGNVWRAKFKALFSFPPVHVAWGDEDPEITGESWDSEGSPLDGGKS